MDSQAVAEKSLPPKSCANWWINVTGLFFLFGGLWILTVTPAGQSVTQSVYFLLALVLFPMLALEFFFFRPPILDRMSEPGVLSRANGRRVLVKLLAVYTIYGLIAFGYWLLPEYNGSFYKPFWNYLLPALPWMVLLAIPYFWLVDALQEEPEDEYYQFGKYILGDGSVSRERVGQLFLGWVVKAFFLPLMVVYLSGNLQDITSGRFTFETITSSFKQFYDWSWKLLIIVDLAYVCIGYSMTLKLIDSNIRSTEPTMLGWTVALICYEPFASTIFSLYTEYDSDHFTWGMWLKDHQGLYIVWGSLILLLMWIYSLSSVAFGHRFSNLTHRGIITNGPYRYSKHPAYLTKNLSWWLISIPFISVNNDPVLAVKQCLLLVLVNLIYYMRAKTEERHLSRDPVYRDYAEWIEQHGFLARLKRAFWVLARREDKVKTGP